MKHRKKSNTLLIFDLLVKHYTKNLLENNDDKSKEIFKIILKYFGKQSVLAEELRLCNMLFKTPINSFETGSRLLSEIKIAASYLNEKEIKELKFKLLLEIYEVVGKDFFNLITTDYRKYASVYQLINDYKDNVKIKNIADKIVLEEEVISNLIDNDVSKQFKVKKFDSTEKLAEKLSYKIFNEKYVDYFNDDEKTIIKEYVAGDFENFAKTKINELKNILKTKKIKDEKVNKKLIEAVEKLDDLVEINDKNEIAYNLVLYQELVDEINKIEE